MEAAAVPEAEAAASTGEPTASQSVDRSEMPAAEPSRPSAAEEPPSAAATGSGPSAEAERKKALGNAAFQAKNFPDAIRFYGEAIEEAGDAVPGVYFSNRAVCRAALGEWAAAREDATEALQRPDGITKKAFFQKVRAELRLGLTPEAKATLEVAKTHGLKDDVLRLLGDEGLAAQVNGAPATPATASSPVGATPSAPSAVPSPAKAAPAASAAPAAAVDVAAQAKEAGNARYKEGAYREALAEYQRALDLLPQSDTERRAAFLGNAAAACLMLRRVDECRSMCEQSLALDPSNSKIRARLANAQVAAGEFAAARASLEAGGVAEGNATLASAARQIDDVERQLAAADAALSAGEPAKALAMFAELETKALFSCPALSLKMGRCYLELKNYPRVLNTTQQVLRANPRNIDALVLRTEALYRNNETAVDSKQWTEPLEQGQRLLREALSFDPDQSGTQALRKRLRLLCTKHGEMKEAFDSREFEKAMEILDAMIAECQDNPVMLGCLYCERAKAGVRQKDWRMVLKDVGQATYRNHSLVQPYLYRAQALQALDRHEDAVKELEGLFSWHREQSVYDKLQEAKFLLRKKKRANYYELLGVPSVASQLEIKKGYREKAAEWHPDKKGHLDEVARKNAEEMFKCIGEAYEVLTDPQKKELYDKGYDLEGINEQIEIKKRRTEAAGGGCGASHCRPGGCGGH